MTNLPTKELGGLRTFDEVIYSWLRDEWYLPHYNQLKRETPQKIIENPNLSDIKENKIRLDLLRPVRSPMIDPLPIDTKWYTVSLNKGDVERTFIVPSSDWLPITKDSYSILEAMKNIDSGLDH